MRVKTAAEAIDLPESVRRVDVGGMTIMPGLIDSHCHISFDEPSSNDELFFHRREGLAAIIAARNVQKLLRAGVTGFMDPDSLDDIGLDLRDAIEAGIIDPTKVSRCALQNAASVAGLMLTTDVLVTELKDEAEPATGATA